MNQHQLTMTRGDSRTYSVTISDLEGDPYDLTGASVWFTVDGLIEKQVGSGIEIETPASGVAVVTIDASDTEDVPDRRTVYRYDVQIQLADGTVKTPIRGLFVITPDVTTTE
jgi:hypothetical protein